MSEAPMTILSRNLDDGPTAVQSGVENRINTSAADPIKACCCAPSNSRGWLMVGLVFAVNFLVFGFFKSLGMLTKILNAEFDATMNVYILMCITYSLNCAAGPLSCYLTRRFSARPIALIGTSMVTTGLILSWFAQSLTFLYFSIGVLAGIGSGLTYPTGVILVSNYFTGTKNAAIANAFVVSGSPIGGMAMPFFISFMSEFYTSRGAFLLVGGVMIHAILCASVFRPPIHHYASTDTSSSINNGASLAPSKLSPGHDPIERTDENYNVCVKENVKGSQIRSCSTGVLTLSKEERECGMSSSAQTVRTLGAQFTFAIPSPPLESVGNKTDDTMPNNSAHGPTVKSWATTNMLTHNKESKRNLQHSGMLPGAGSKPYVLSLDHSCIILCPSQTDMIMKRKHTHFSESVAVEDGWSRGAGEDLESEREQQAEKTTRQRATWKFISPLRNPIYVFLLLSNTATAISTANIYLMVSQLVEESDTEYTRTSTIYLLISFADLLGRITGAFLCDKKFASSSVIYAVGLLTAGISSSLLASFASFVELCAGTLVYGFFSGFHVGIYGLLLTNIVGIKKIHAGYGISMLINGTIQCIAILLSGRMISLYSSSFTWLAPTFGGILATGGIIWIFGMLLCGKKSKDNSLVGSLQRNDTVNNKTDEGNRT